MKLTKTSIILAILIFGVGTYFLLRHSNLIDTITFFKDRSLNIERPALPKEKGCECPENGWLNCMPAIGTTKRTQCTEECINWSKNNCPNFQGVAY